MFKEGGLREGLQKGYQEGFQEELGNIVRPPEKRPFF
jgi:hypothetical protein